MENAVYIVTFDSEAAHNAIYGVFKTEELANDHASTMKDLPELYSNVKVTLHVVEADPKK